MADLANLIDWEKGAIDGSFSPRKKSGLYKFEGFVKNVKGKKNSLRTGLKPSKPFSIMVEMKVFNFWSLCVCKNPPFMLLPLYSVKKVGSSSFTVQYLAGLEIKPVRTVLKSSGIHRLLVIFRAYVMTYNFQTFFLPQYIKLCKVFMSILFNFWKSYFI